MFKTTPQIALIADRVKQYNDGLLTFAELLVCMTGGINAMTFEDQSVLLEVFVNADYASNLEWEKSMGL